MKFGHGQVLNTWDTLEELSPGDKITVAGKPATVFDIVDGDEIYIVYVLDGKKTKKELSMFDALLPSETSEDEEEEWDDAFGEPPAEFEEKPEVEVRYIAPGKDIFDMPGLRRAPGRRNRPMTSLVPPVAESKTMRISKNKLRRIIREAVINETLPPHLAKFFDGKGNLKPDAAERVRKAREKNPNPRAKIKDATPVGYGPDESYVGPTVPNDMMNRIDALRRGDLQDHLYDIVDAIESGDPDYTIEMLKLNLRDAERMERQ